MVFTIHLLIIKQIVGTQKFMLRNINLMDDYNSALERYVA